MNTPVSISIETARHFILGKQGLWPGRRWRGIAGTEAAMRAMEHLQLDPLQIVARSQDLKLHSRVLDYTPGLWEDLAYGQRKFFDWGGWLAVRPMEELPHWRVMMRREREDARWMAEARTHADAIVEMRQILHERETVSNRDFEMKQRVRVDSYRGRKDSAVALYYLWRVGEVMVHHRERFERVYGLTENIAPAHLLIESDEAEAERYFIKKEIAFFGLCKLQSWGSLLKRTVSLAETKAHYETMLAEGELMTVQVEGWKGPRYALAADAPLIAELNAGGIPKTWTPLDTTNEQEVLFLAPLDVVSARGRAKELFGFDYIWEVYKPLELRKWGYYTLPILWRDQLVARADLKLDRTTNTLVLCGFWLEQPSTGKDAAFAEALANGVARFMIFVSAAKLDASCIKPVTLRKRVQAVAKRSP